ncbi:MAG: undecaprenyl-phosphate glucose phosphotransferase [Chloroflexi bacterium]|nr:undecaprenyl-phosphate glucose phosphotransferase [Chloroflexota bacterium]
MPQSNRPFALLARNTAQRRYQTVVTAVLVVVDVVSIGMAMYVAFRLRELLPIPEPARIPLRFLGFWPLIAVQISCIVVSFFFARMYHRRRARYSSDELTAIFSATSIGTLWSIAITALIFQDDNAMSNFPRLAVVYGWLLSVVFVIIARAVMARVQRILQRRGIGRTRVAVIGAGEPAATVIQRIRETPRLGYDIIGMAATDGQTPPTNVRSLGSVDDIGAVLAREGIDEVIIAIPEATNEDLMRVISRCDRSSIGIKVVPDMFQILAGQLSIGELGGVPLLNMRDVSLRGWKLTLKRTIDITGSAFGLVVGAPLFFLTAALVKLDSPGPALFTQERMGLDGERFPVFKFRTMRVDAEKLGLWTTKDDPRRTRLGTLLRRTNIDELPQLINVLLGHMSLVGPRPEQPLFVEQFRASIPRYMERHREKAGLTGWAQVNGLRGDTSIEERTRYDLWYIENWSVWLDIKIILLTVWQTIVRDNKNAY